MKRLPPRSSRRTAMARVSAGLAIGMLAAGAAAQPSQAVPNKVAGTWQMVSASIDPDGARIPAYGARPRGMLVFTTDMRYVEVLTDGDLPRFASDVRGQGTDEENRKAMAASIGMFGRYTVDAQGDFSGNVVEGATFPNWIGNVRTTAELRLRVEGDRMFEEFRRPDGTRIAIEFQRVR
ncbi:lipocalin-like domain-containing protein [Pseudorhodoferax sp. Leaf265]|uniref:lipocalin-like domain-containing protein n=1 Tax=Pseudorhodoferax sp. Leaf265 TaxID=1736315 RepID=UPI00190FDEBB|nr:lipocalin-like domain-containing protein [Pseudorhodoferax sp. Leaf265]